jgi:hypothetical protein
MGAAGQAQREVRLLCVALQQVSCVSQEFMDADTCLRADDLCDFRRGFAILTWVSFYSRSACRATEFTMQLVNSAWKLVPRLNVLLCQYSETKAQVPRKLSNIYVTYHSTLRVEHFY